jgi:hypothetical protein
MEKNDKFLTLLNIDLSKIKAHSGRKMETSPINDIPIPAFKPKNESSQNLFKMEFKNGDRSQFSADLSPVKKKF